MTIGATDLMRILSLLFVLFLSGCDTVNVEQFRIAGDANHDEARVRSILQAVAARTGLVDCTSTSLAPHTIVFYTQPNVQSFRVELGARTVKKDILVDLSSGFGPKPTEFKLAERFLRPVLVHEFGSRMTTKQGFDVLQTTNQ